MQITEVFMILIFTLGTGICIPIGGMIARVMNSHYMIEITDIKFTQLALN